MRKAKIVILEGSWWKDHEEPQVLPYFHALANSNKQIELHYRTFRSVEDIEYYVAKIPRNAKVFLYFACHGTELSLRPSNDGKLISQAELMNALGKSRPGAIEFVHFGCCEMVNPKARRESHQKILDVTGARWSSGYTKDVDWLDTMFLELALVNDVFVKQKTSRDGRTTQLKRTASTFYNDYEQLARKLGFSALTQLSKEDKMFPDRLNS